MRIGCDEYTCCLIVPWCSMDTSSLFTMNDSKGSGVAGIENDLVRCGDNRFASLLGGLGKASGDTEIPVVVGFMSMLH